MILANLTRADVKIIAFALSDDSRPALTGVCVRRVGFEIELRATDGYTLVSRTVTLVDDWNGEEFIIPAYVFKVALRMGATAIELHDDYCYISEYKTGITFDPIDGKYPDTDKLVSNATSHLSVTSQHLNPKFVQKVLAYVGQFSPSSVNISMTGAFSPLRIESKNVYGLVMPLKG